LAALRDFHNACGVTGRLELRGQGCNHHVNPAQAAQLSEIKEEYLHLVNN
jgi:hypothetical protein